MLAAAAAATERKQKQPDMSGSGIACGRRGRGRGERGEKNVSRACLPLARAVARLEDRWTDG